MASERELAQTVKVRPRAYRFDDFEADLGTCQLTKAGRPIAVEPRVFDTLVYLIDQRERLIRKQELIDEVWGGNFVSDNALSRAIARLRHCLGDDTKNPRYIETVHGRGYRFVADVATVESDDARTDPWNVSLWNRVAIAAVLVAGAFGATLWWRASLEPTPGEQAAEAPAVRDGLDPRRVAVLPLVNLSNGEEGRFFADGLSEQMTSVLAQIDGIRVISSTTAGTYRDGSRRISEIASELGTGTLLEGSVRRGADELRVTVKLVDAESEELLWTRDFDTRLEDVFAVQSEVATQVADALQLSIPSSAIERIRLGPTREITAYDHYLRGRLAYREHSRTGNETAVQHYRRAVEIDPEFALAHAGLANAYALRSIRFGFGAEQSRAAEATARRALAIEPRLAEAYKALGMIAFERGDVQRALEYSQQALEINPSYDEALYNASSYSQFLGAWDQALLYQLRAANFTTGRAAVASYLLFLGFEAEGSKLARLVLQDEPLTGYLNLNLAVHEARAGNVGSARQRISRLLSADPTWTRAHLAAGELELWLGNLDLAATHFARALQLSPQQLEARYRVAVVDHLSGRVEEASKQFDRLERNLSQELEGAGDDWYPYWLLGAIAAIRGDMDAAIELREKAIAGGWREYWRDRDDPALEALRADPRFAAQLEFMKRDLEAMRERVRGQVEAALPRLLRAGGNSRS